MPASHVLVADQKWSKSGSNNFEISPIESAQDCYTICLVHNSGNCYSISYSDSLEECFFPLDDGTTVITDVDKDDSNQFNTYLFLRTGYNESLPTNTEVTGYIYHKGISYTDSTNNYEVTWVSSAEDCFRVCQMSNAGQCIAFSWGSDTCYIPLTTTFTELADTSDASYTTYLISSYTMFAAGSYMAASGTAYHNGLVETDPIYHFLIDADSYSDCATICYIVNSGRCVVFNFASSTCYIPFDSGSLDASSLTQKALSGSTAYILVKTSSDETVYLSTYSLLSSQYMYLGNSLDDGSVNTKSTSVVSTAEDCYRLCYLSYGENCKVFTFGSGTCAFPSQSTAFSYLSDVKHGTDSSLNAYYVFDPASRTEVHSSASYSYLSNLRIRDGRSGSEYEMVFSSVVDLNACYRLCLQTMSSCKTFSYDPNTDLCYLTTVDFHAHWTYVDSISGCTGYFTKNSGLWKLMTKHIAYENVMPDDAYNHDSSFQQTVPAADLSASDSYTTNNYLKNQMIDYWDSLSSKYRIKMDLLDKTGNLLKTMQYNATSSTRTNWFSAGNFVSSSYSDLSSSHAHKFWTMGDSGRTFYICYTEATCTGDAGWLQISSTANSGCAEWDSSTNVPKFLYSAGTGYVTWASGGSEFYVLMIYMSFN
ncbi:uncharacterized protein [Watersipora subatra]|uniref:uncharacterized protein n=1 Tax=Watersipora subatra TaxID=2589382 RepID=UPI00355BAE5B